MTNESSNLTNYVVTRKPSHSVSGPGTVRLPEAIQSRTGSNQSGPGALPGPQPQGAPLVNYVVSHPSQRASLTESLGLHSMTLGHGGSHGIHGNTNDAVETVSNVDTCSLYTVEAPLCAPLSELWEKAK